MEPNIKLYQKIANHFKTEIFNGVYKVGDMLPAERVIAEQMEVSRTVIREAMIMLEVEGYVEVRKGSGIRVINTQVDNVVPDIAQAVGDFGFMLNADNQRSSGTAASSVLLNGVLSSFSNWSSPPLRSTAR